jgi:hypothetical protein
MESHLALSVILLVAKISTPVTLKTYDKASVGKPVDNLFYMLIANIVIASVNN